MALTRDQLIPSTLVDQVFTPPPCPSGAAVLFLARCADLVSFVARCTAGLPVTNGHWEFHPTFSNLSFNIVADCNGNNCSGTFDAAVVSPSCSTGPLTWNATTTGAAAAAAEEGTAQGLEGSEGYGQPPEGGQIETNEDGDVLIIAPRTPQ